MELFEIPQGFSTLALDSESLSYRFSELIKTSLSEREKVKVDDPVNQGDWNVTLDLLSMLHM